jgi:hypothetical protein
MPVLDQEQRPDDRLIRLGRGDIGVCRAIDAESGLPREFVLYQHNIEHPIGERYTGDIGKQTDALTQPTRLQFTRLESIEVLIIELAIFRQQLIDAVRVAGVEAVFPDVDKGPVCDPSLSEDQRLLELTIRALGLSSNSEE